MHLYIIQVFNEPHGKTDWVTEYDFFDHPGLLPFAEYVSEAPDRAAAIRSIGQWLEDRHLGIISGSTAFTLAPDARRDYFKGAFPKFRTALDALGKVTEKQYVNDHLLVENLLTDLNFSFSDRNDDHVMVYNNPPVPFDQFIRTAEPDTFYYIGGILDCLY